MAKKPSTDLASSLLASFDALERKPKAEESPPKPVESQNGPKMAKSAPPGSGEALDPKIASKKTKAPSAPKKKVSVEPVKLDRAIAMRSTITYHGSDSDMADEIIDVLKKYAGVRATFSEAVRIALALCPKEPDDIMRVWRAKREEDGRVLRHKSGQ